MTQVFLMILSLKSFFDVFIKLIVKAINNLEKNKSIQTNNFTCSP